MDTQLFMDAEIRPHRSLSSRGLIVLIGVVTTINVVWAAFFLVIGAGPIPVFLGLDILAVVVAFTLSNRAAGVLERVQVTAAEVRVTRESRAGAELLWISPTSQTRVRLLAEDRVGAGEVELTQPGRGLRVARALSRPERAQFARALDRAIWRARKARSAA